MRISDWSSDVCSSDLFFKGHKSVIRLDIYNFLNLLDSAWGETMGETFSDNTRYLARLATVNPDGTYTYNLGRDSSPTWEELSEYDANASSPSSVVSRCSAILTLLYQLDRKCVVGGQGGSVRINLGGR